MPSNSERVADAASTRAPETGRIPRSALVTISREFGAGGSELAALLGARLRWRILDHNLVHLVAERLRLSDEEVAPHDEHAPGFLERVGRTLLLSSPELLIAPAAARVPDDEVIARTAQRILQEEAQKLPLIVVGHGAQCLFRGHPGTLHLRLVAPVSSRIRRVCARLGCDEQNALGLLHRMDADRRKYVQEYFNCDLTNPVLYDLQVNTGRVSIETTAELVATLLSISEENGGRTADPKKSNSH